MNPKSTLGLALLAAALAAFLWFYEIEGEAERARVAQAGARIFTGLDAVDVVWLELDTSDGVTVRAEREDGRWRLQAPLSFPADPVTLDAMAGALGDLAREQAIEPGQPLHIYGLGDSARRVAFGTADSSDGLRIGNKTPLGANTYVARSADDAVFTVPTWRTNAFTKELLDVRDRRVLAFDQASVRRLEVNWPGGVRVGIVRTDGGWQIVEPLETAAATDRVDTLLSDLAYLRADGFVDEPRTDAEAGLEPPDFEMSLELSPAAGDEARRTLRFALGREDGNGLRLARGTHSTLYELPAERIADFPREFAAYRDRQLSAFVPSEADRIEAVFAREGSEGRPSAASERVEVQRHDLAWTAVPALRGPVAAEWVATLSDLEAESVLAESAGDAERAALGLQPPRVHLRVIGRPPEGDAPPLLLGEVMLGKVDPRHGIVAMRPGRPEIFWLALAVAERLPVDYEALENRFLALAPATETGDEPVGGAPATGD